MSTSAERGPNVELRDFLRSRRARIRPEEAGLSPHAGRRRVPGLRREEVAELAGVSVDYYVRLERGRTPNASAAVLDAVARALRLDQTERAHLFDLAKPRPGSGRRRPAPPQRVRPGLLRVLDALTDTPAMILGHRLDVLAANPLAKALYTDFDALPHCDRNLARFIFLDPTAHDLLTDWETAARGTVAVLRLYAGRHPHDPRLNELVGELSVRDEDFRQWWADHDVLQYTHGTKLYRHPLVGELTLTYESLTLPDDPDQALYLYTAEPGSPSDQALRLLASWSTPARPSR
ncbi:helix-turn-helix transcriptional regulator [Streptomyces sp. RS10V-4]|uniref:helix-turn-helix transcriptional regulator n=1 Tax=Streptomyces rhizoryzae TaxID=2932493 RepID=UPI002005C6EA|nr:helix-turn-helix transcriptional regulator [Streptomyces rhizoryzae]MCK7621612.1 helix-turn-helix transcriptional regulator [Streptomyces rhizoryzae]